MYKSIYVPVDNSEYSNQAVKTAIQIGQAFEAKMVGSHVYAAAMHDYRFKQMEYTLPTEYIQEEELERQRKIHDSLITMGLELISDCYLQDMSKQCQSARLDFEPKMMDGKHHLEIVRDIKETGYDLTVLGVLGLGKTKESQIGSVCERVTRHTEKDVLVIKHIPEDDEPERDTILVGVDGSPDSFGGLLTAIDLAEKLNKKIEIISVYDPYLHYVVFRSIVDVLTEKAGKVFRFEEQNQLHEEVIDTGLAQIYQSHLNIAEKLAAEKGVTVKKSLLDGKAFHKILGRAREIEPFLLVVGRIGVHALEGETGLGNTTENLLRLCPCDILLTTRTEYPALDRRAEETIVWTAEAEAKMERVPKLMKGIARTGILRLAIEKGHSVITESVIEDAMDRFMPKYVSQATVKLAEKMAFTKAREDGVSMCKNCGVTAAVSGAKQCSVCGSTDFEHVTNEMIEQIAASQGGLEDDVTYDGRKLKWSKDARDELNSIEDKYQRRRAKARIEKVARNRRLQAVDKELAIKVIDDDVGRQSLTESLGESKENGTGEVGEIKPLETYDQDDDLKQIALDENGAAIKSVFPWDEDAVQRLLLVPAGFMRGKTQERTENVALNRKQTRITLELIEAGIDVGKQIMEQVVQTMDQAGSVEEAIAAITESPQSSEKASAEAPEPGKCPFSAMAEGDQQGTAAKQAMTKMKEVYKAEQKCPITGVNKDAVTKPKTKSNVYEGPVDTILNEAGLMHEIEKRRKDLNN